MTNSIWDWDDPNSTPTRVPDFPHRRQAVIGFIRGLPESSAGRKGLASFTDCSPEATSRVTGVTDGGASWVIGATPVVFAFA